MRKKDAMEIMRRNLNQAKEIISRDPQDSYHRGYAQGLESALYFLDERQAVKDMEAKIESYNSENQVGAK